MTLVSIFVASYWRRLAAEAFPLTLSPEGDLFVEEVRLQTEIEDYDFKGPRDPLQQWCDDQRAAARLRAERGDGDGDRF
ncbi:hypothetical protein [Dactylosporangium salmoneum]|uniref:Uncharacterized protein n=1 Tax=Dactylosporangium salmoneum TaxID=53361 RepID=A0ABP5T7G1_9ACTN